MPKFLLPSRALTPRPFAYEAVPPQWRDGMCDRFVHERSLGSSSTRKEKKFGNFSLFSNGPIQIGNVHSSLHEISFSSQLKYGSVNTIRGFKTCNPCTHFRS